ncbi:MAG TPA: pseudouridine-5-phosphate glycosidase [Acidimicrobiaceae bacterium]|nr:pseudouridine-5-phosphate glycosidase [Acidimicrobiaceae bacterium]
MNSTALQVHPEVAEALAAGRAVVALESTIISHGMPYPQNEEMALEVEGIVRAGGAVPATIAVIDGQCQIGLSPEHLHHLATVGGVVKATTRDLPWLVASGFTGATTVAATMKLAAMAGIRVFATGGIGGVHRGAAFSMDISADLTEMAATPVAVVSAGVKSILDIRLTLERLETLGVPVVVNGSDDFPSFFSRTSGLPAPRRLDGPHEIARMLHAAWQQLGLGCGVSIANPIPAEFEVPADEISAVIDQALADLDTEGITGQDVTPFLLKRVMERTEGRSLAANLALVRNNAATAAAIAVEYAKLCA